MVPPRSIPRRSISMRSRAAEVRLTAGDPAAWTSSYLRKAAVADVACALVAGVLALAAYDVHYHNWTHQAAAYLAFTAVLPILWWVSVAVAGGYDSRFIGVGSDEFRRVLNAAVSLTAGVAIISYALKLEFARGYVVVALPSATVFDLVVRHRLRRRLHRLRSRGACIDRKST